MNLLWIDEILPLPDVLHSMDALSEVYSSASIKQAEELLHIHRIDLCLISDSMSGGDPLSIFSPDSEDGPVIAVIGHASNLSFTQRAMERVCCGYLTLPISGDVLCSMVQRMIARAQQRSDARSFQESLPIIQNAFWQALIDRRISANDTALPNAAKRYAVQLPSRVMPVYLRYRNPGNFPADDTDPLSILSCPAYFAPLQVQVTTLGRQTLLILLFGPALSLDAVASGCKQLLAACKEHHLYTVCMLGEPCTCPELPDQAVRMQQAGENQVYLDNHLLPNTPGALPMTTPPQPNAEKLLTLLDCGMFQETIDTAEAFFFNPDVVPQINAHFLENYKYQLLDGLRNLELVRKSSTDILVDVPSELMTQAGTSVQDFLALLQTICATLDRLGTTDRDQRNLAEEIKIHIREHLDYALTRNSIAERFYVSADHLDRIFKRECGKTVTDYILQERIALSKQLLTGSSLSISEVAAKVGFVNFSHFSSVFKKSTGLTPFLFRKQHSTEEKKADSSCV